MANALRELVKSMEVPGYLIADDTGLSRSKVYNAIKKGNGIPPETRIETVITIAEYLGCRVQIKIVPIEPIEGDNGKV